MRLSVRLRRSRCRSRAAALLVPVLLVALALSSCLPATPPPPPPSDGSPGSAGVPVMGQSRLTADQLVAYYQKRSGLAYRATGATLQQLAADVRHRGQPLQRARRHRVRAVDRRDRVVQLPRQRDGAGLQQQLLRHRRVRHLRQRLPVQQRALRCARAAAAPAQLRRQHVEHLEHPRPAGARALGQHPVDGGVQLRPLLRQGPRAALEQHGQRQLGHGTQLRDRRAQRLQPDADRQRPARTVPGRRARCSVRSPRPVRAPSACASPAVRSPPPRPVASYVLNGNGAVTAFNGAPYFGSPALGRLRRRPATST